MEDPVGPARWLILYQSSGSLLCRGQTILLERERIKRRTIQPRRLMHHQNAA